MASISSLTGSSSATSIYGNRNVISGLASGLDTETLIENAVSGYKSKITSLQQQQELVQWKQDAYRSIIDKMVAMTRKYTSYTSSTNLFSQSFFNKAVLTTAGGDNASKVSASGRTSSDVRIDAIKQLATAAKYTISADKTEAGKLAANQDGQTLTVSGAGFDLSGKTDVSTMDGSMTIKYGGSSVYLSFGELDTYKNAEELAAGIREKLGESYVKAGNGEYVKASDRIDVKVDNGVISFADKSSAGNSVYISSASGNAKTTLGLDPGEDATSISVGDKKLSTEVPTMTYLQGKSMDFTFNGTTKTITFDKDFMDGVKAGIPAFGDETSVGNQDYVNSFAAQLNVKLAEKFGEGKVTVGVLDGTDTKGNPAPSFTFQIAKGSTLNVTSEVGKAFGLTDKGISTYVNTSRTLGEILGEKAFQNYDGKTEDKDGNPVKKSITINGTTIEFDKNTTLESMMNSINSNKDAGVNISYSKLTNEFSITAKETGAAGKVEMSGPLAEVFGFKDGTEPAGTKFEPGQDAIFTARVNGTEMEMTRSSNTVDLDGLSVTLKGTFGYKLDADGKPTDVRDEAADPITFETKTDSDTIIDAIKTFVDDYNALVTEIREQYATLPATKSSKDTSRYMPLTDKDKETMSDAAIEAYEAKAKQGILFGESDLSTLHDKLRSAITAVGDQTGENSSALAKIGITTSYSSYLTTLELDTNKLREALDSDPDSVRDIFTKSKENGAESDGLMKNIKDVLDMYANTSTGSPGILIQRAGSAFAPTSINSNTLQTDYDNLTNQIEKWQDKMSDRVDYYTKQFTALEQLMAQMNNQSSMLSGLMMGNGS